MTAPLQQMPVPSDLSAGLFKLSFKALGTHCLVQFRAPGEASARHFRATALSWLRDFEATFSRFIPTSVVSRLNAQAGGAGLDLAPEVERLFELGDWVFSASHGINDPSSLPLTRLWDEAAQTQIIPSIQERTKAQDCVGWEKIERRGGRVRLPSPGMAVDFGGFGKEFAVDYVLQLAVEQGIDNILVDLGRDIATCGRPPGQPVWVVGVEAAAVPDRPVLRAGLSGEAMASSGNYRRYRVIAGRRFGHLIDPRTGEPACTEVEGVTCIAQRCVTAGLFSQTAFILGVDAGLRLMEAQSGVEGVVQSPGRLWRTRDFYRYELPNPV
jgi:thiamine biosynthesis lipoprotein